MKEFLSPVYNVGNSQVMSAATLSLLLSFSKDKEEISGLCAFFKMEETPNNGYSPLILIVLPRELHPADRFLYLNFLLYFCLTE